MAERELDLNFGKTIIVYCKHAASAAATMRTKATAIVVSATDDSVRAFSGGKTVFQIDPDVVHDHMRMEE
jgi:hypothetical protein